MGPVVSIDSDADLADEDPLAEARQRLAGHNSVNTSRNEQETADALFQAGTTHVEPSAACPAQ